MEIENYINLNLLKPAGVAAWLFLTALIVKVWSTLTGLKLKLSLGAKSRTPDGIWWLSKASALVLCSSAAALCHYAGDRPGELVFVSLLVASSVTVGLLAIRRYRWPVKR